MTVFGLDLSRFQEPLSLPAVGQQGYVFFAAKCTEGQGFVDPSYADKYKEAKATGALFVAYHFLRSDSSAAAQAANLEAHIIDKSVPVMIDCEVSGASRPNLRHCVAFRDECAKRGIKVTLLYYPHFWWAQSGCPSLKGWNLWQAIYPRSTHQYGGGLYAADGGDSGAGWHVQGGVTPVLWQFGSTGKVDGYDGNVDVDAFRGTRHDLAATGLFKDFAAPRFLPRAGSKAALAANIEYSNRLRRVKRLPGGKMDKLIQVTLKAMAVQRRALQKPVRVAP